MTDDELFKSARLYIQDPATGQKGFNLEPYPKNPIIASFFRTIKYADQLGSGVRKMFRYTKLYSGSNPTFSEGDVFRITAPLDELYSFDVDKVTEKVADKVADKVTENTIQTITEGDAGEKVTEKVTDRVTDRVAEKVTEKQAQILEEIEKNPYISQEELSKIIGISRIHINKNMGKLQEMNLLQRVGGDFGGQWKVINKDKIIIWTKKS